MAKDDAVSTLSVFGSTGGPRDAYTDAALATIVQQGPNTALKIQGVGTLVDVKNSAGTSVLKLTQSPPTVSGSRSGGAAITSLLTQLASLGLIIDGSTA